jgi:hypothetical protein
MNNYWEKLGCILEPQKDVNWLSGGCGPCFARIDKDNDNYAEIYISGRDVHNRSRIGRAIFDFEKNKIVSIDPEPILRLGNIGAFDENGTSYPWIVNTGEKDYLFYTGWIKGVHVKWYNDLGLATSSDGKTFERHSRAPLALRNNHDYIGIGSASIIKDKDQWKMWYTRFDKWVSETNHYYNIKYASSSDGINWAPDHDICVDFSGPNEYAIAKPCVLFIDNRFVMWYSYRGAYYTCGLAVSDDGKKWLRIDNKVGIERSKMGWDKDMICYPFVLQKDKSFYMFYCGNKYGVEGLGLAKVDENILHENIK